MSTPPVDRIGNCSGRIRSGSAKANLKMSAAPEAKNQPPPRKGAYTKHISALHKDQFIRVQVGDFWLVLTTPAITFSLLCIGGWFVNKKWFVCDVKIALTHNF